MRCKILTGKNVIQLEEKVNTWFEQNPRLEIIYVAQSFQPTREKSTRRIVISIFYEGGLKNNFQKEDLSIS